MIGRYDWCYWFMVRISIVILIPCLCTERYLLIVNDYIDGVGIRWLLLLLFLNLLFWLFGRWADSLFYYLWVFDTICSDYYHYCCSVVDPTTWLIVVHWYLVEPPPSTITFLLMENSMYFSPILLFTLLVLVITVTLLFVSVDCRYGWFAFPFTFCLPGICRVVLSPFIRLRWFSIRCLYPPFSSAVDHTCSLDCCYRFIAAFTVRTAVMLLPLLLVVFDADDTFHTISVAVFCTVGLILTLIAGGLALYGITDCCWSLLIPLRWFYYRWMLLVGADSVLFSLPVDLFCLVDIHSPICYLMEPYVAANFGIILTFIHAAHLEWTTLVFWWLPLPVPLLFCCSDLHLFTTITVRYYDSYIRLRCSERLSLLMWRYVWRDWRSHWR